MPVNLDPKWIGTGVGAAIGLVLARKGLPKKYRGLKADIAGLGLGGGLGYVAGETYNDLSRGYGDPGKGSMVYGEDILKDPAKFSKAPTPQELEITAPDAEGIGIEPGLFNNRMVRMSGNEIPASRNLRFRINILERGLQEGRFAPADIPKAQAALEANKQMLTKVTPGALTLMQRGVGAGIGSLIDLVTN